MFLALETVVVFGDEPLLGEVVVDATRLVDVNLEQRARRRQLHLTRLEVLGHQEALVLQEHLREVARVAAELEQPQQQYTDATIYTHNRQSLSTRLHSVATTSNVHKGLQCKQTCTYFFF